MSASAPTLTRTYWLSVVAESASSVSVERDWWIVISALPLDAAGPRFLHVADARTRTAEAGEAALPEVERATRVLGYLKASPWERKELGWVAWVEPAADWWSELLAINSQREPAS